MGQTLIKNYIHIVFRTKNQQNFINDEIEVGLFAYIGGICNSLDCIPIKVGGYKNHVHIVSSF